MRSRALGIAAMWALMSCAGLGAAEVRVADSAAFRQAVQELTPGTILLLAPGTYEGGVSLHEVTGTEQAPIVIEGVDPNRPPIFRKGGTAFHLSDCRYVTLRNLRVEGFPGNGINVDDGVYFANTGAEAYKRAQ